jgi:uncharacterized protein (TIGR02996 family)
LEQAVLDNPEDMSLRVALADWLCERADPRGEFIRLQLDFERHDLSAELLAARRQREQELLTAHERTWLGELAEPLLRQKAFFVQRGPGPLYMPYRFRRGWLDRLAIDGSWFGAQTDKARRKLGFADYQRTRAREFADFMRVLSTSAVGRLIEDLFLYTFVTDRVSALPREYPSLRRVTRLVLGDDSDPRGDGFDDGRLAVPLIASMPGLAHLFVWLPDLDPTRFCALPTLQGVRSLRVCLGNSPSPEAWPRALAGADSLHNLSDLAFCHAETGNCCDVLCEGLVRSGALRRLSGLKTLALDCVTDLGIRTLGSCPELRNLSKLGIESRGDLSDEGVTRLRTAGVNVSLDDGRRRR